MGEQEQALRDGLDTVDQSQRFLLAIIVSVFLSLGVLIAQKNWLSALLRGEDCPAPALYPPRHIASSINVGALGFFLCLTAHTLRGADPNDPVALRSAHANLLAAALVFVAAGIRLDDVQFLHCNGRL